MSIPKQPHGVLKDIGPDRIVQNPANPRLFFRPEEMDTLLASIRRYGIQVPITVYQDGDRFVLIDGERRWRCAKKLNLAKIPALVQPKPTELSNLLLMFNIHALREQWDYLTIANKLPDVIDLYRAENSSEPTESDLSEITGLTRGQIRRCRFLFELPQKYRRRLEEDLAKPKSLQTLSEDLFIEMEKALKTVRARLPNAVPSLDRARDALIAKVQSKVIGNITDFRKLSKIATSVSNVGISKQKAEKAIADILDPQKSLSIERVYAERFEFRYDERKVSLSIDSILDFLGADESSVVVGSKLSAELRQKLDALQKLIARVLEG